MEGQRRWMWNNQLPNRQTLYLIEKGSPGASIGAAFNVLRALGLEDDFLKLAADDQLGKKLQDIELLSKK
jgi:hypothetical protein